MKKLHLKTIAGVLYLLVFMSAALFLPAWTFDYWQAWACLVVFFSVSAAMSIYLMRADPALLERRLKAGAGAETEKSQKIIQTFTQILFTALLVLPALDRRFRWSRVPTLACILGDVLIVAGFAIVFAVFRVNNHTSGVIEVAADQKVVSTGPYALVRHPMYSGALVLMAAIPVALGSWWGLLVVVPMTAAIVWRLLDEEKFLAANLPGYSAFQQKVKYRLAPWIW
jgi:protein-S-isoprenylcysteine O-methyltransferase Ste14